MHMSILTIELFTTLLAFEPWSAHVLLHMCSVASLVCVLYSADLTLVDGPVRGMLVAEMLGEVMFVMGGKVTLCAEVLLDPGVSWTLPQTAHQAFILLHHCAVS